MLKFGTKNTHMVYGMTSRKLVLVYFMKHLNNQNQKTELLYIVHVLKIVSTTIT